LIDLARLLTDKDYFLAFANSKEAKEFLDNEEEPRTAVERWSIFSRIRFEYVRPTCTLRSLSVPSVCPTLPLKDKEWGLRAYAKAGLFPDLSKIEILHQAIDNPKAGTLSLKLKDYYQSWQVPVPGKAPSLFPANYIIVHDLHHALLGIGADPAGELDIIAFESGNITKSPAPILLLEQLEIFLGDTGLINAARLTSMWAAGMKAELLVENWDWQSDLFLPIEQVKAKYNIDV
jgi:hypothetical protein